MAFFVAAGAALLVLVVLDRLSEVFVRAVAGAPDSLAPDFGVAHEDFEIESGDHCLATWLLKPEGDPRQPVFLLAHGWGASYETILRLGEPLVRAGYEVLLFDIRGHGRNEEVPYVTIRHFREDVTAALRYARGRFPDRPLVFVGHSLGGAAGILAAAEGAPLDGLVTIAAPSDVMRITSEYLSDHGMPGPLITTLFRPFWWRRIGGTFRPLTPSRRVHEIRAPLLMIQPENDLRVARRHADRLAKAAGQSYELVRGAEHTDVLGHPETLRLVEAFAAEVAG